MEYLGLWQQEVTQKLIAVVLKILMTTNAFSYIARKLCWDLRLVEADDQVDSFANTFRRKLLNNFVALNCLMTVRIKLRDLR